MALNTNIPVSGLTYNGVPFQLAGGLPYITGTFVPVSDNSNIAFVHNAGYTKYAMVICIDELADIEAIAESDKVRTARAVELFDSAVASSIVARQNYDGETQTWGTQAAASAPTATVNSTGNITASTLKGATYRWWVIDLSGVA